MDRLVIGYVEIAVESFGAPDAPLIVLAMGATYSMLGWPAPLCEALAARGFRVLRYDHRDTGLSTTVAPGAATYTVEDLAADLVGLIAAQGAGRAHVVGMSLGGYIGQVAALSAPERIASLTLIGAEPLGWDGPPLPHIAPVFLEHFETLADLDWSDREAAIAFLTGVARLCAGSAIPFDAAAARAEAAAVLTRTSSPLSAFNHATVATQGDWTAAFRRIAQPVLVLHGEEDPILPLANGQALAAGIPGADLRILPGVGHELPAVLIPTIADAIAGLAARA